MLKKLNSLSFVIGLFFLIISIILLFDYYFEVNAKFQVNLYAGICFLLFGCLMLILKSEE